MTTILLLLLCPVFVIPQGSNCPRSIQFINYALFMIWVGLVLGLFLTTKVYTFILLGMRSTIHNNEQYLNIVSTLVSNEKGIKSRNA